MRELLYLLLVISIIFFNSGELFASADICKVNCRTRDGLICLERGPCEPVNDLLLETAERCRKESKARYEPVTKLVFVDILSNVIRLDRELPQDRIAQMTDEERYKVETKLLKDKGIEIFWGTEPKEPLTREELAEVLKNVTIEKNLGFSSGLADQLIELENEEFVLYDMELYVDEGDGYELWERKKTLSGSSSEDRHYMVKLDSCGEAILTFGDGIKGKIPDVGSNMKASYKFFGRSHEVVTECEIAMLLSNPEAARSLKESYNPARLLTKDTFADLLLSSMGLENKIPAGTGKLSRRELYELKVKILSAKGINVFTGSGPNDILTREELARVLYDSPVEEMLGMSSGKSRQVFELDNAGFIIYDLHTYVYGENGFEEWEKTNSFMESASSDKHYSVKLDSGNYASIHFGNGKKGMMPPENVPIKVTYRLYAPITMITEDDIICVLGKSKPVAETYVPPSFPPPDFPPPTDGFDDPATHI